MVYTLGPVHLQQPVAPSVVRHRQSFRALGRLPPLPCQPVTPGVLANAAALVGVAAAALVRGSSSVRRKSWKNHQVLRPQRQPGRIKSAAVRATSSSGGAIAGSITERNVFFDTILNQFGYPLGGFLKDLSEPLADFVFEVRSKLGNPMDNDIHAMLVVARLREMQLQAEIFNEERKVKLLRVVLNGVQRSIEDIDEEVVELELERDQALERAKNAESVLEEHDQAMLRLEKARRELDAELLVARLRRGGYASKPHSAADEQPPQGALLSPGTMDEAALRRECSYWLRSDTSQDLPPAPTEGTSLARLRAWVRTARLKGRKSQQLVSGLPSRGSSRQTSRVRLAAAHSPQGLAPEGNGGTAGNPVGWILGNIGQPKVHFFGRAACAVPDSPPAHSFARGFVGASLQQPSMARSQTTTVPRMEQSSRTTHGRFIDDEASLIVLAASLAREVKLQRQLSQCRRSAITLKATLNATTKYTRETEEEALALEMARDEALARAQKAETTVFHERLHRSTKLREAKEDLERALTAARTQLGLDSDVHTVEPSLREQCLPSPGSMDEEQLRAEGARLGYGPPPAGEEANLAKLRAWVRSARLRARKL